MVACMNVNKDISNKFGIKELSISNANIKAFIERRGCLLFGHLMLPFCQIC